LANLENAFYPITAPPQAGKPQDWLATGRAFALNTLPMDAEWMLIVREDYNGQTFWRLYLKARYQDGSQGMPLTRAPWDMNARYSNDTLAFEAGGKYAPIPEGYWVDFTALALRYNWERLPSLQNWRAFYPATRFNQFILPGNLDWDSAMAQLYPPEALVTATGLPTFTPTHTPTITPRWRWASLTFTPTPTPILSVTPRPTWTPLPGTNQP
jgi:TolB protein